MSKAILLCVIAVLVGAPAVSGKWLACRQLIQHIWHKQLPYFDFNIEVRNTYEPIEYVRDSNRHGNAFLPLQINQKPLPKIILNAITYELQTFDINSLDQYHTPTASGVLQLKFSHHQPNEPEECLVFVVPFLDDPDYDERRNPSLQLDLEHLIALGQEGSYETDFQWLLPLSRIVTVIRKPPVESDSNCERSIVLMTKCMNIRLLPISSIFRSYEASSPE